MFILDEIFTFCDSFNHFRVMLGYSVKVKLF